MSREHEQHQGLATRCVHAGETRDPQGAIHTPLYNHSTFGFAATQDVLDVVEGRSQRSLYTRYGLNPTIWSVERKLADIEGGELAWVFSSGMAAEPQPSLPTARAVTTSSALATCTGAPSSCWAPTCPTWVSRPRSLLGSELDRLDKTIRETTRIVFLETPTNPSMEVLDIARIAQVAHARGALLVVDNTFATPVNQSPLQLGADLVVHSTTKYMGGHSDLTGGAVIGPKPLLDPIWSWRKNMGQMMAPEVAFLLARSLRTLVVRMQAHNAPPRRRTALRIRHPLPRLRRADVALRRVVLTFRRLGRLPPCRGRRRAPRARASTRSAHRGATHLQGLWPARVHHRGPERCAVGLQQRRRVRPEAR